MEQSKIKEVFADAVFVKELLGLESAQSVQQALKEKGIKATIEEILQLRDVLAKTADGEMSLEEMDTAAGGLSEGLVQALTNNSTIVQSHVFSPGTPSGVVLSKELFQSARW